MKTLSSPNEEMMLLETISRLSAQVHHGDRDRMTYADYEHCSLLLEMIDEMEQQLESIRKLP